MDDEFRAGVNELLERVPDAPLNVSAVVASGTKAKWRRRASAMVASIAVGTISLVGLQTMLGSNRGRPPERPDTAAHEDGVFVPAGKGEPTYELYAFDIRYPWAPVLEKIPPKGRARYCDLPGREWECGHRKEQAGFAYKWRWSTRHYPGEVQCRVILFSKAGNEVGRAQWGLSGLETESRQPDVIAVRVSGRPRSAEAACEAGSYERGPGVEVEFVRAESYTPSRPPGAEPVPDRIRLFFEADAVGEEDHVGSRMCVMTLWFESGKRTRGEFTTNQGPGTWKFDTGHPASDPITDAAIRCRAIKASDS